MATFSLLEHNHNISLKQAVAMTTRFREHRKQFLSDGLDLQLPANALPVAETFNKEAFSVFMKNPDCAGIRIYYGMSENLDVHAIIVGVDFENRDILPEIAETILEEIGILDDGARCPPDCPEDSPLNQP
jgi:hypothetical protein